MGIALSDKKCIITPFRHHSFTFLKMRVRLEDTGKVTMKLGRNSIRSIRRKLSVFRSWRAHAKRCNSHDTLETMDERFVRLFAKELA